MSKIAVVYWSGTGNTETMANAVVEGAKSSGNKILSFVIAVLDSCTVSGWANSVEFSADAAGSCTKLSSACTPPSDSPSERSVPL